MERQARTRTPLRALQPIDFSASRLPPRCHQYQAGGTASYKDFWPIVAIEGAKMGQKSGPVKKPAEQVVKEIRRATRRQFTAEGKMRILLSGLRGAAASPSCVAVSGLSRPCIIGSKESMRLGNRCCR